MSFVIRGRGLIVVLAVFILAFLVVILPRPLLAIYNQNKAGSLLAETMNSNAKITACEMSPLTNKNDRDHVQAAVALLGQAIHAEPRYAQSYLHLGRAYCLLDHPDKAVEAFKNYTMLRPENSLGHLELGIAQQKLCVYEELQNIAITRLPSTQGEIGICQDKDLMLRIQEDWRLYAIDTVQSLSKARTYFNKKQYSDANIWYHRAINFELNSMDELPESDKFKWAISVILAHSTFPQILKDRLPILDITSQTTIPADQLRFFREIPVRKIGYGDVLLTKYLNQHTVGILYWSGPAGVFIDVQQDGWYQVTVQVQNTPPAPVILQLEDGFQYFGKIELNRGDQSWQIFQFNVLLQKGIHLLDVNYINDGTVNGVDRNAIIEWIRIDRTGESD